MMLEIEQDQFLTRRHALQGDAAGVGMRPVGNLAHGTVLAKFSIRHGKERVELVWIESDSAIGHGRSPVEAHEQ